MYLLYADESGDPGLVTGSTDFFIISGLIINERQWNSVFQGVVELRRDLGKRYGIPQRVFLHGYDMIHGHGDFHQSQYGLKTSHRFSIYRDVVEFLAGQGDSLRILNLVVKKDRVKAKDIDLFDRAWEMYIQRFHNFLVKGGHAGAADEFGLLFTDRTHDDALRRVTRRMRAFNYVPSMFPGGGPRNLLVTRILDDPIPRESAYSYFVQMADLVAYALALRDFPRGWLKKHRMEQVFDILNPVLLTAASRDNPQGIVYWPK